MILTPNECYLITLAPPSMRQLDIQHKGQHKKIPKIPLEFVQLHFYNLMIRRIEKGFNWLLSIELLLLTILISLATYTNVPTLPDKEDKYIFNNLGMSEGAASGASFQDQLAMIRQVQTEVFKKAPLGNGIPNYKPREPADLMRYGQGLCYDRSRTFDKAFNFLGFESRHVYILYKNNLPFWKAAFHYGQPSHAVTEVKTSRGWMLVDSNTQWIALTRTGEPVNADEVWKRITEFDNPPNYLINPWWAIRGLYSRKGQFYGAGISFPELNWPDFLHWFVERQES